MHDGLDGMVRSASRSSKKSCSLSTWLGRGADPWGCAGRSGATDRGGTEAWGEAGQE